jgi:hypothetical protein
MGKKEQKEEKNEIIHRECELYDYHQHHLETAQENVVANQTKEATV